MERVYVANLPPDIRIKDIDDFFRPFGKLVYIDVNHRSNPVYAYVQFDSARNAFNAVKSRHGYDYEGYTLQLRLVENKVMKRRDATPPPPPPPMFNNYNDRRNNDGGFNNNYGGSNNNRIGGNFSGNSTSSQWPSVNRPGMQPYPSNNLSMPENNMLDISSNNRSNIIPQSNMMQFSSNSRSNMDQQFSNTNRLSMQQYSNSNRSNMHQQYSNSNRSDMLQQNYSNRSDMLPYGRSNMMQQQSNTNRSNIPQLQNMNIEYPNNNSWNIENNNMGWKVGNFGNDSSGFSNFAPNEVYNANNDPYAKPGFEDNYTSGLSGAGRRWFNRYIRKGYSPEMARIKALEHRTVPYLRDDPKNKPIPKNPTNVALETIGNTIISLLSTNPADNQGPSTSLAPQDQINAVSKYQYLKSLAVLKRIKRKTEQSAKDRISVKYHTQIVKDYEISRDYDKFKKNIIGPSNVAKTNKKPVITTRTEDQILELMRKKKAALLKASGKEGKVGKRQKSASYKKRVGILRNEYGFLELEALALAIHPLEKLQEILSLKRELDMVATKIEFLPSHSQSLKNVPKSVIYQRDIKYLEQYEAHRISRLSKTILSACRECLRRVHEYEKKENLPLRENRFTKMLIKITSRVGPRPPRNQKKQIQNQATATAKSNNKTDEEKKVNNDHSKVNENQKEEKNPQEKEEENPQDKNEEIPQEIEEEFVENDVDNEDDEAMAEDNDDKTEEQHDQEEEFDDVEYVGDEEEDQEQNDHAEDENKGE